MSENNSSSRYPVLKILADGHFHSGQSLGDRLGMSRTAVWKQIKKLEELGIDCFSVKGKGYRIPGGMELLDHGYISSGLTDRAEREIQQIHIFEEIDSTNSFLLNLAKEQNIDGTVCLAERQFAGKGRRGRQWQSPYGKNIYLSYACRFEKGATALEGLSLAIGVAVARALEVSGVQGVSLKWPNDILHDFKKLGGILVELVGEANGVCTVVIGVGINMDMPEADAAVIDQPWTDLKSISQRDLLSRNALCSGLLNEIHSVVDDFRESGFSAFREHWQDLHAFHGETVTITTASSAVEGVVSGVDGGGALRLKTADGELLFNAGEVSLRPAGEDR